MQGREANELQKQYAQQNALQQFMQQNGGAVLSGDKNALARYAGFDPQGAMEIQKGNLSMEATRQDMSTQTAQLQITRENAKRAAAEHALTMDEAERVKNQRELEKIANAGLVAYKNGPEAWGKWNDTFPDYENVPYEEAPSALALIIGAHEGLMPAKKSFRPATPEEAAKYGAVGGQFDAGTGKFDPINPPSTMSLVSNGEGGMTFTQGPAKGAAQEAARADNKLVSTDTLINAATQARELIGGTTTGIAGQALGNLAPTRAAELRRQVAVLKSTATIETLNQMRQSSPTGGALGNVTEGEGQMLAAKAGAIDPNARPEDFTRQLDDYERTLLRTVNGFEDGDRIFEETRKQDGAGALETGGVQGPQTMPEWMTTDPRTWSPEQKATFDAYADENLK
jgi:hypothetical protein